MARVVLVTGVSTGAGRRFASALAADPGVDRVIGVDVRPPDPDPDDAASGVTFVRADIRSPAIGKTLQRHEVDTVVHLGVQPPPPGGRGRAVVKEANVIGSMQLLAACQRLRGIRRLVLRSTTAVYGSSPDDPSMFSEDMEPRRMPTSAYARDAIEVERYVRGFARRRPDVAVCALRFSSVIGPSVRTALTEYLTLPVVPTMLGFDPRLQFVHTDDLVNALITATLAGPESVAGEGSCAVVNVSGDGVLTLVQALRRLGRPVLPVPGFAFRPLRHAYRAARWGQVDSEQAAFLTYGRGVDTTRMREELKFEPAYDSQAAFETFVASVQLGPLDAERVRAAEQELADALGVRVPHGR